MAFHLTIKLKHNAPARSLNRFKIHIESCTTVVHFGAGSVRGDGVYFKAPAAATPVMSPSCVPVVPPGLPHRHASDGDRDFVPCKHYAAEPSEGSRGRRASASTGGASTRHRRPGPGSGPAETPLPSSSSSARSGARRRGEFPPHRLSRLGPCTQTVAESQRQRRFPPFPYAARRIIASLSAPAAAKKGKKGEKKRGEEKKSFQLMISPRNWGRGRGRRPIRES